MNIFSSISKAIFLLRADVIDFDIHLNPHIPCMLLERFESEVKFSNVSNSFVVNVNGPGNFSHGYHGISLHSANYLPAIFRSVFSCFSCST